MKSPRSTALEHRLRRIALERQGLLSRTPFGTGLAGVRCAIERLGYVQIDTISIVTRAHHHVLQTRVPGYRPDMIERLQAQGAVFEYWAHAAAYLPMRDFRFALVHMKAMRDRQVRWVRSHDDALMKRVLARIRAQGPLMARDFVAADHGRAGGWWNWKPAKQALEQLFMQGDLMVAGRVGFQKVYDLTERVLPDGVDTREPTLVEFAAHLVRQQLTAQGMASVRACTYQRQTPGLRAAVQAVLEEARHDGTVYPVTLDRAGGPAEAVYVDAAALAQRAPAARARAHLLSPFDNLIIERQRTRSLFGFDYQLECYVPAAKRRFGYFCLPLLYRDRLVGRADCKAHRKRGQLEIKRLFVEHPQHLGSDVAAACGALADALLRFAGYNGCPRLTLGAVQPDSWRRPLAAALDHLEGDYRALSAS